MMPRSWKGKVPDTLTLGKKAIVGLVGGGAALLGVGVLGGWLLAHGHNAAATAPGPSAPAHGSAAAPATPSAIHEPLQAREPPSSPSPSDGVHLAPDSPSARQPATPEPPKPIPATRPEPRPAPAPAPKAGDRTQTAPKGGPKAGDRAPTAPQEAPNKGTLSRIGSALKRGLSGGESAAAKFARFVSNAGRMRGFHESAPLDGASVISLLRGKGVGRPAGPSRGVGAGREEHFPVATYTGGFAWPVEVGIVSSEFGERWGKLHAGIDIAADEGDPVYASAQGVVIYAGNGLSGYGNVVILRHDTNVTTLYGHNQHLNVREGDSVKQGAVIAKLGSTGHSTGPHVHFEIRDGEKPVNPRARLPGNKYIGK
jgi:murein DD-endopeptidase MepM/ murein hydrolase activator NlpD